MDLLLIINNLQILLMLIFTKICMMDKDRAKLLSKIAIGTINFQMIQSKRKSKITEPYQKIQIIKNKVSFQ